VHPLLSHDCGLPGVVGALEIGPLLRLQPLPVLRPVGHVVQPLLGHLLRLGLSFATSEASAFPTAVKRRADLGCPVDRASALAVRLPALSAVQQATVSWSGVHQHEHR
jgi:hypothetical protein